MNDKWEYKVIGVDGILDVEQAEDLQSKLNEFGTEGWELVGILDQVNSGWGVQPRVESNFILMKRKFE